MLKLSLRSLFTAVFVSTCVAHSSAMVFSKVAMPDGLRVVLGRGPIVSGDAERLRVALGSADRDPFGNKSLALDSDGGLVAEAFKMVALMDREKVSTIVPPGLSCASACAQIVFLAGVHRVVLDGGRLGMHSCSLDGARNELCNEAIAQNALAHGTAYGSVMAFMKYTDPSGIVWFGAKDVDCFGISLWPPGFNRGTKQGEVAPYVRRAIEGAMRGQSK